MGRLIIIRGNSACGKSTIAKKLQEIMGYGTMLVQQDIIRRDILRVKDGLGNPSIQLIQDTAIYGRKIGYDVIVEGILSKDVYGSMLEDMMEHFTDGVFVYYFDIPFEETMIRHMGKPEAKVYGEKEMLEWWLEHDVLGVKNEQILGEEFTEERILNRIISDLGC